MSGEILVDLGAYRANLDTIRSVVAPAEVMAVVKADAYGHGLAPVARAATAAGIRRLGALDVPTALELCALELGDVTPFAWLLGPTEPYRDAVDAGVELGVSTVDQLRQIADARASRPAALHLKIDTGLHRNGATEEEWPGLVSAALELERAGVARLAGVWTHISEASDEEDTEAIRRFDAAIAVVEGLGGAVPLRHLAASAASFARPDARYDLVRVGAFGYGIAPGGGIGPAELGLIPVMTLTAPVVSSDGELTVIGIGYGDGISSVAAGAVSVALGGRLWPVVGVRRSETVVAGPGRPGERATLFGPGASGEQTLQEWADAMGTIGEEIVTRLSPDIPRRHT